MTRPLHGQYRLSIFCFIPVTKYQATPSNPRGPRKIMKTPMLFFALVFSFCGHEEFRLLHNQYTLWIFLFASLQNYLARSSNPRRSVPQTPLGPAHIQKTSQRGFLYVCGPTRIRTSVAGFGDQHSTTEL